MKKNLIVLIFIFISCVIDKNPLDPNLFQNKIIGTWKSDGQTISFFKDNTFIRPIHIYIEIDEIIPQPEIIYQGNYSIYGNLLKFENITLTRLDSSLVSIGYYPFFAEISFIDNLLIMQDVNILNKIEGSGKEIWGTWTVTRWGCHYSGPPINSSYSGRIKETYKFLRDTLTVNYIIECIDDESFIKYDSNLYFTYNKPYLEIYDLNYFNLKVEFKNSKMCWYSGSAEFVKEE